jgi:N-acetylmuramic acid 6-phosphate etherase
VDRSARIISIITGLDRSASLEMLDRAGGKVKVALVMHGRGLDREAAERLLDEHGGAVRAVMEDR